MTCTLVLLHGNSANPSSFSYIDKYLTEYTRIYLYYDSSSGFTNNLQQMKLQLDSVEGDIILIGHSLGGLYCLYLSQFLGERVKGAISLATPFNGCEFAGIMSLFSSKRVLKDVSQFSVPVTASKRIIFKHPWLAIVTTLGRHPLMLKPNDGYVSKDSMMIREDMLHCEVAEDHYSVLESLDVVSIIKRSIKRACLTKKDKVA